jgi:hypothetical protein
VDCPKSQYFFLRHEKKGRFCLVHLLIFVEKKRPAARSSCDATPPAEYLIICSD